MRCNPGPDALAALVGPAPCDDCPNRRRCATERLACAAFTIFAKGASERRWQGALREPTAIRFDRLFHRE